MCIQIKELPVSDNAGSFCIFIMQVDSDGNGTSQRMLMAENNGAFPDGIHILAVDVTGIPGKSAMKEMYELCRDRR